MTMGPEPMIKILWMSVRLGIETNGDARSETLLSVAGVVELYTHDGRATNLPRGPFLARRRDAAKIESVKRFGVFYVRLRGAREMAANPELRYTLEEYFALDRTSEERFEFWNGEVF